MPCNDGIGAATALVPSNAEVSTNLARVTGNARRLIGSNLAFTRASFFDASFPVLAKQLLESMSDEMPSRSIGDWRDQLGSNRRFVLKHSGSQLTPFAERQRVAVGGEHLNANVVGAGGVMLANTISDCIEITPSDDGVDQPITAATPEIIFAESEP